MPAGTRRLFAACLVVVLLVPIAPAGALAGDNSDALSSVAPADLPAVVPGDVPAAVANRLIVRWRDGTLPAARAVALRAEGAAMVRRLGPSMDLVDTRGRSVRAVAEALARRGAALYAERDQVRTFWADPSNEPWFDELWGLHNTGQRVNGVAGLADVDVDLPRAARTTLGRSGVVVAVIDDGVDLSHPELVERAWRNPGETGSGRANNGRDDDGNGLVDDVHGWDFLHDDASVHDFEQDYHGTHVAGTIAGSLNGIGFVGVAPQVKIMALKFGDSSGGSTSNAIRAIRYAAAKGADVINASWGGPGESRALREAIADAGILVVAAAGNSGLNNDTSASRSYPASYNLANIIAVAAADARGELAGFSNFGPTTVDLVAPGVNILSAYPRTSTNPPAAAFLDGTSMAAPHVTGVAALVVSVRPQLGEHPSQLRRRLMQTVQPAAATMGLTATGGLLNAGDAVDFVPPVVTAPQVRLAADRTATAAGAVPVEVTWSATDRGSGVARFRLERRTDGGAWSSVSLPSPTATSLARTLLPGQRTEFRVRAWDAVGNASGFAVSTAAELVMRQDGSSRVTRTGTWTALSDPSALGGGLHASDEAGASAALSFSGRSVAWIAERGPGHGLAKVYIGGSLVASIDLEAPSTEPRSALFARSWKGNRTRMIEIRVVGTDGRPTVTLDAFAFLR